MFNKCFAFAFSLSHQKSPILILLILFRCTTVDFDILYDLYHSGRLNRDILATVMNANKSAPEDLENYSMADVLSFLHRICSKIEQEYNKMTGLEACYLAIRTTTSPWQHTVKTGLKNAIRNIWRGPTFTKQEQQYADEIMVKHFSCIHGFIG